MPKINYYALPQGLYDYAGVRQILSYGNNAILHKVLNYDVVDTEALMASHCIVYVLSGDIQVNTYEGHEVKIGKNQMLFMPRDSYVVSDFVRHDERLEVLLLFFSHEIIETFLAQQRGIIQSGSADVCILNDSENICRYIDTIKHLVVQNPHDKYLLEVKLLEFLYLVAQKDKTLLLSTLHHSETKKQKRNIFALMHKHYDKNLSVEDFAALSGKSLSTLNREFKHKYNTTPKQWLIEQKVHKAHELLLAGATVTEVAFDVGYHNVSAFIKAYKSIYHQTPKRMQMSL